MLIVIYGIPDWKFKSHLMIMAGLRIARHSSIKNYFMKKVSLFLLCCFATCLMYAQKIVKEHYTVSGGILGAADFTKFQDKNPAGIDYDLETGWSAGGWINFPVSKAFSIEPQ